MVARGYDVSHTMGPSVVSFIEPGVELISRIVCDGMGMNLILFLEAIRKKKYIFYLNLLLILRSDWTLSALCCLYRTGIYGLHVLLNNKVYFPRKLFD